MKMQRSLTIWTLALLALLIGLNVGTTATTPNQRYVSNIGRGSNEPAPVSTPNPKIRLEVLVRDSEGHGVPDATVNAWYPPFDSPSYEGQTNDQGIAILEVDRL